MTTATFKVGDKVQHRTFGAGEIKFGPFKHGTTGDGDAYLMAQEADGVTAIVVPEALTVQSAFAVGDKVLVYGYPHTIEAGPFTAPGDHTFFVVKDEGGRHVTADARSLTLVERAPAPNTFEYDGVTYDLDARYRDKDGDTWRFSSDPLADDLTPRGSLNGAPNDAWWPLGYVVHTFGPLTRI